jgi:hypothetical protein
MVHLVEVCSTARAALPGTRLKRADSQDLALCNQQGDSAPHDSKERTPASVA